MNVDNPNLRPANDPEGPDYLATAVLQGLARPAYERLTWGCLGTASIGILSFGLAPILVWTRRFRQYVTVEQQQLWHLAEWLRLHAKNPDAAKLRDEAETLRVHSDLRLLSSLCLGFLAIIFYTQLHDYRHFWWDAVLDCTYLYPLHHLHPWTFGRVSQALAFRLFNTWTLTLSGAYICHWLQVQQHAGALRKFVAHFNEIVKAEGLTPIDPKIPGSGIRPMWMMAAAVMASTGAVWAVPMMLAGAAHRRMIRFAGNGNRAAMAHRLRAMLMSRRPTENIPMPIYLRRLCGNERCRAPIQDSACFCPRCGSRIVPSLHRVG